MVKESLERIYSAIAEVITITGELIVEYGELDAILAQGQTLEKAILTLIKSVVVRKILSEQTI